MANEIEANVETMKNFSEQCRTCLSIGRKMVPSGEFADIFRSITSECKCMPSKRSEELLLCWECHSLLRKVKRFQNQVQRANKHLILGQSLVYSLSNLTTVIIKSNEPNQIYIFDQKLEMDEETNCISTNKDQSDFESIGSTCNFKNIQNKKDIDDNYLIKENKPTNDKKKINKWAEKRAMLNKKPKFKIIDRKSSLSKIFLNKKLFEKDVFNNIKNQIVDTNIEPLKCTECGIGFKKRKLLEVHTTKRHGEEVESYICDVCHKNLPNKKQLSAHINNDCCVYKCRICDELCYGKNQRWRHLKKHKVLQCLKCELLFGSRQDFFKHYKQWHEKFICDYCGISFKMRYCIEDHIKKQHTPFECKSCSKRFARYNGLWLHNKIHHGGPSSPAYCVECDRKYPDSYRYKWHLANSTKHKPRQKVRIPCPECSKVFSKNIYMKDHYNLVHLKNYKYRCEECNKNFIRNADLTKHTRRIHEGIMPPKNKICYMCGRGFTTNKILANHLRTHTGERPFACAHCKARFAQSAALASHVRTVHCR